MKLNAVLMCGIEVGETRVSPKLVKAMVVLCWEGITKCGGG